MKLLFTEFKYTRVLSMLNMSPRLADICYSGSLFNRCGILGNSTSHVS